MYVADNCDWGLDVHDIALLHQQLLRLGAYCLDYGIGEEFFPVQARDAFVEVDTGWEAYSESCLLLRGVQRHTRKARHLDGRLPKEMRQ